MKFHTSAAAIIFGSFLLFGFIYFAIDRISQASTTEANKDFVPKKISKATAPRAGMAKVSKVENKKVLDQKDRVVIEAIAALSEHELKSEFTFLNQRLKQEDLFSKLEGGLLDAQKKADAKATIERYTLLGIESTRRKYLPLEPELRDAVYAHRDTLKDIRKLIDKY